MGLLDGKHALVTGGSRGIGRAIALKFASEGADVAITFFSRKEEADAVVAEICAMGRRAVCYQSDASDFNAAGETVAAADAFLGGLDILVNNAGVTRDSLLIRMDEQQWDTVINANLKSVFNYCRHAGALMMRRRSGSIINISSVVGLGGNAGQCNYAASKAGVIGLTMSVAKELGTRGVRANCIAPGFILTEMTSRLPDNLKDMWIQDTLLKRAGLPEDVANVALFLASELSSYITGETINCSAHMRN